MVFNICDDCLLAIYGHAGIVQVSWIWRLLGSPNPPSWHAMRADELVSISSCSKVAYGGGGCSKVRKVAEDLEVGVEIQVMHAGV